MEPMREDTPDNIERGLYTVAAAIERLAEAVIGLAQTHKEGCEYVGGCVVDAAQELSD
jgi:hypothetical protein